MNVHLIKRGFEEAGWKQVQPGHHLGIDFDLVGHRRFLITKWHILIKALPVLDQPTANAWRDNFERMSKKSKSVFVGKCFVLCLVAEEVSTQVSESLAADGFGLFGVVRLKGGGGTVFVADGSTRQVYGKVPALPYDVHKFSKGARDILFRSMTASDSV